MTISSSGFNINFLPTPSIYERQTTGQTEQKNRGEVAGNVTMVPQSDQDLVPLTKVQDRNLWNYKAESGHPALKPMSTMRGEAANVREDNVSWQDSLKELYDKLPDDVKTILEGTPTIYTESFQLVLELGARASNWQDAAVRSSNSEGAQNLAKANADFPEAGFSTTLAAGQELVGLAQQHLQTIGPNDPSYSEVKEFADSLQELLNEPQAPS